MATDVRYEVHLDGIDRFEKSIGSLESHVTSFENTIGGLKKAFIGLFAVDKIVEFGKSMVETGAKFEAYEIGLGTLLHSEAKAHEAFEQIKKDASSTPFDTDSLIQANRALISAGASAEEARKVTLDLGNAIAATGGGSDELSRMAVNLQQIKNIGKASALDIKQFAFAGINVYEALAKSTGKSIDQVKTMSVSYDVLAKALSDAHAAGGIYEGGLEKMGKSTQVQVSNLEDMMTFLKVDIFNAIKPALNEAMGAIGNVMQGIKDILPSLIDGFKPVWGVVKEIAGTLFSIGKEILPEVLGMIHPIIESFKITWNLIKALITPLIGQLKPVLELIKNVMMDIVSLFQKLAPALEPVMHIIGTVLAMMIKITVAIDKAILSIIRWIASMPFIVKIFTVIKDAISWVIDKIKFAITAVKAALEWLGLIEEDTKKPQSAKTLIEGEKEEKETGVIAGLGAGGNIPEIKAGSQSDKVTGTKQVIINVSIQKLVELIKIMPQTMKEGATEMERHVVNALLNSVNQFSASTDI